MSKDLKTETRTTATRWLLALSLLAACSSNIEPRTVALESLSVQSDICHQLSEKAGRFTTNPMVYSCAEHGADPFFVTTLRDCSVPEKLTFQTTTRQLLVGVLGLKVIMQEPVQLGTLKVLQTVASGSLDAEPVLLSTFTFRRDSCVTDLVLWRPLKAPPLETDNATHFTEAASRLTAKLLGANQ
jgi:hypothetical protein